MSTGAEAGLAALAGGVAYVLRREPNDSLTVVQTVRGPVEGCCVTWTSSGRSLAVGDEHGGVTVTSRTGV